MFGSGKIQYLEAKLNELKGKLSQVSKENDSLKQDLESARKKISDLEGQLASTDVEKAKKQLESSIAEYQGLKDLYVRKNQEFDADREEKEQTFARQAAVDRFNLENEIKDHRQANQDYVSSTVKAFSESYNYYLHQIKLLMDALGDVATRTGETLFSEPNDDLKARIGQQMAEKLKAETDPLRDDAGNMILIGSTDKAKEEAEEEIPPEAEAEEPEIAPAAEEPAEEPVEVPEEAEAEAPACEEPETCMGTPAYAEPEAEPTEDVPEEAEPPEEFPEDAKLDADPEEVPEPEEPEETEEIKKAASLFESEAWKA